MPEPEPRQPSLPPIEPGVVLAGKYRVEREIGRGGMGVVVEAWHIALEERVALKFLVPAHASQPDAAARFQREAQAAAKIKSEHVARVSDVGTLDTGAPYMVMEYLVGEDLSKVLLTRGPLPLEEALDYVIQACEAIAQAHGQGIIHRDLKPANLFLTRRADGSPLVKVLDFGISKMDRPGRVENLTRTDVSMGSALYMSPEQMLATRSADHRTDIYALSASLYELLAGRPPFYGTTVPSVCAEVLTGTPTPLAQFRPDLPGAFAAVLERGYARDLKVRYDSIAQLVLALAPFAPTWTLPLITRIARMGGLAPPVADESGSYRAALASQPQAASGLTPIPQQGAGSAEEEPPQAYGPRPIPPRAFPSPLTQRIVPEPYIGPSSSRAAAIFATGRISAIDFPSARVSKVSSPLAVVAMVAGALVLGLLAGALALRHRAAAEAEAEAVAGSKPLSEAPAAQPAPAPVAPAALSSAPPSAPAPPAPTAVPEVQPAADPTPSARAPSPPPSRQGGGNHPPATARTSAPRPPKQVDLNDPN